MNQKDQSEIEHSKASQDSMRMGAGPGQPDDDEGSITPGSPNNLLLVAVSVGLLIFAGLVFFIAAVFGDSDATWDKWGIAETILLYVGTGVFYAGGFWSVWAPWPQRDQTMFPDVLLRSLVFFQGWRCSRHPGRCPSSSRSWRQSLWTRLAARGLPGRLQGSGQCLRGGY